MADGRAPEPAHIGDGVYVSFDGFHINIAVNHHTNHVVALEDTVMQALMRYGREVDQAFGVQRYGPEAVGG